MTESQWMALTDPRPMLDFLRGRASERKLRLFAVACCRRISAFLPDEGCRSALETAERFADGFASLEDLREARRAALSSFDNSQGTPETAAAAVACACWTEDDGRGHPMELVDVVDECYGLGRESTGWRNGGRIEFQRHCRDLRDIFGNPFRNPSLPHACISPEVNTIAHTIYDTRAFDLLPQLADALRRAGCDEESFLTHCHAKGPHVRGCWVVDAVLRKD